ncbi:MAG: M23 family metallopeptidase [archaeon GB-1867-097]|nr:M23 family metallopeptidase [Candidatus Culexmicrobium thermophilum]HDO21038.1 hypothetical protein [Candidatus Bathyarchaeota archaeon]
MSNYMVIAKCKNVELKLPIKCWYSFFNSPYPAHKSQSAVDIYFPTKEALLPVDEGHVLEVERFECPGKRSDSEEYDYLILIDLGEGLVTKILHVKPKVNVGEKIFLGDYIGDLIVSGFFYSWSNLHMHLEIRSWNDPYRALGAFKIDISPSLENFAKRIVDFPSNFTVKYMSNSYLWLQPYSAMHYPFGLALRGRCGWGFIDGGIPHYGHGAFLNCNLNENAPLMFHQDLIVGEVFFSCSSHSLFKPLRSPWIENVRLRGVGSYFNQPLLKAILLSGKTPFKCGDIVSLNFK